MCIERERWQPVGLAALRVVEKAAEASARRGWVARAQTPAIAVTSSGRIERNGKLN